MEYEEFLSAFRKEFEERLGGNIHTGTIEVSKNNLGRISGLAVFEENVMLGPVIYPKELYKYYKEGREISVLAGAAAETYKQEIRKMESLKEFCNGIFKWESAKKHIKPVLLNAGWNRELLEETVSVPFLDLAVCFQLQAVRSDGRFLNCRISKKLLSSWALSEGELMKQAMKNLEETEYIITGFDELMEEMFGSKYCKENEKELKKETGFAILSTPERTFGASGIFKKGLLSGYADKLGKNLYLLPSSIHELIIIADDGNVDSAELDETVKEVNREQVLREEQLSDHAYYYDRVKDEVRIAE